MAKLQRRTRRDRAGDDPGEPTTQQAPEPAAEGDPTDRRTTAQRLRLSVAGSGPVLLLQASHPRQALATGLGLGIAALAADRPAREAAVVAATGVVGQAILGWHNDIVDRATDARHHTPGKPVADGRLEVGSAWYALVLGVLLVIPLSISTGVDAGTFYLAALAVGLLGNVVLRRGRLSWVSWAVQYALYAPFLALGGWGGTAVGEPPEVAMVVLFGLLGIGVHFLRSVWGLVADDADGWTYLPLVLGRRLGAARLLAVSAAYTGAVLVAIVVVGTTLGLRH
ncbi:UbiA family prenyltransferase [Nocardioides rubriscoriae]|uniref:UbiA family prenyltransferase n=1 Tax=Nocardioides rubriscoriae TaxID=642762 RepID=UPI0011E000DB|nr:UbiA family prenyltransferase [Nocardioides rubriscoriae]